MTPSFSGRMAWMWPACGRSSAWPRRRRPAGRPSRTLTATTDGSLRTMPRPRTYTTVLAVPRSTAMSRPMIEERTFSDIAGKASARCHRGSGAAYWCARPGEQVRPCRSRTARHPRRRNRIATIAAVSGRGNQSAISRAADSWRVGAVDEVLGGDRGEVAADRAGLGVVDLGGADQRAHEREGVVGRALDDHRERPATG